LQKLENAIQHEKLKLENKLRQFKNQKKPR
jgi:hypothetical protein